MIVLRGLAAVLLGLAAAAVVNGLAMALLDWTTHLLPSGPMVKGPADVLMLVVLGPVVTAPAWLAFCLLVLPVVTWRTRAGERPADETLAAVALLTGAALMLPLGLLLVGGGPSPLLLVLTVLGSIGGATMMTAWRFLVLDHLTPRNPTDGVSLG